MSTMTRATLAIGGIALVTIAVIVFLVFRVTMAVPRPHLAHPRRLGQRQRERQCECQCQRGRERIGLGVRGARQRVHARALATKTAGQLTVGTDNPAFPPYFSEPAEGETATDPWEFGDPTNGRGFESAIAYALADQLGFGEDQVTWIPVPFNNSIAPGPKDFDVYLAQVSFTEERTQAVDLSEGYFFSNQALVTTAGTRWPTPPPSPRSPASASAPRATRPA